MKWDKKFPGRIESMFRAMGNIVTTHMMDPQLHNFKDAKATGIAEPNGDMAFDHEELPTASALPGGLQVVQLG